MKIDPLREEFDRLLDALNFEMVINQALIDILVSKGVISHEELQEKIKEIKIKSGIVLSSASGEGKKPQ